MVSEAWDMVTAGWYIATKPMGHGALGHGEHGTYGVSEPFLKPHSIRNCSK